MNQIHVNSHLQQQLMMPRVNDFSQLGIAGVASSTSGKKNGNPAYHAPTESLLGMALYDLDAMVNEAGLHGGYRRSSIGNSRQHDGIVPAFHPVDEYKDLSLKEILDLTDDFVSPERESILNGVNDCNPEIFEPVPLLSGDLTISEVQQQIQQQQFQLLQQQQQLQMLRQRQLHLQQMTYIDGNWQSSIHNSTLPTQNPSTIELNRTEPIQFPHENFQRNDAIHGNFSTSANDLFVDPLVGVIAPVVTTSSSVSVHTNCIGTKITSNDKKRSFTSVTVSSDIVDNEDHFNDDGLDTEDLDSDGEHRFRPYQAGQWSEKFEELCQYRKKTGHCLVPHTYTENLALARWVKRQRYQYKLMVEGKSSTMTEERVKALEEIGFVWDSQGAAWGDRMHELELFKQEFSHCNVPSNYYDNPRLATWIKCQRRQYKLYMENKPSNMTPQRICYLEKLGFEWELRNYKKARKSN